MKRLRHLICIICLPFLGNAQDMTNKNGFEINQDFLDYNVQILDNKVTSFDSSLSQSVRIAYNRYLSRTWELSTGINNGFLFNQTQEGQLIRKSYLLGIDADVRFKLYNGTFFKTSARIGPYFSFGYNVNYLTNYEALNLTPFAVTNEYGFGLKVALSERSKLNMSVALNQQLNGDFDTHVQYRLGYSQTIGAKPKKKPDTTPEGDYDGDGIVDAEDECPTVAGIDSFSGCPTDPSSVQNLADSFFDKLDELELVVQKLKDDIAKLEQEQIVEVEYYESDLSEDRTGKTNPSVPTKPIVKKVDKQDPKPVVETNKVDPDKESKSANDTAAIASTKNSKTEPKLNPEDYVRRSGDKAYYVIAISTKDKELAESAAKRISADYNMVHVLPQPNGFYRVGIYATKTKAEALKVLSYAKEHGIPSGWISYE